MTLIELAEMVKAQGLYPIPVAGDANECDDPLFAGTIDDYFAAARILGAKAVLLYSSKLEEADFLCDADVDDDDDSETDDKNAETKLDLTLVSPSLANFKKRIGSEYAFRLSAISDLTNLDAHIREEWWHDFQTEKDKAIDKVEEDREAIIEKMETRELEKERQFLKLVKDLINDPDFVVIPTQRSMKAYALEKHPALEGMDDNIFTQEIQFVRDKIKAKGLDKRRR